MIRWIERIAGVFEIHRFGLKTVILKEKIQHFNIAQSEHKVQVILYLHELNILLNVHIYIEVATEMVQLPCRFASTQIFLSLQYLRFGRTSYLTSPWRGDLAHHELKSSLQRRQSDSLRSNSAAHVVSLGNVPTYCIPCAVYSCVHCFRLGKSHDWKHTRWRFRDRKSVV